MARELAILVTARNMASGVLKDVRKDVKGIQSEAKRGLQQTSKNLAILGVAAGGALATQVHQGLQSLGRLETIAAQTGAVITSTGGAAKVTGEQIRAQADEIERLTGIESESIQEGQNLLLTFTRLRNEAGKGNDIFSQATDIMVDMSHALGQEASATAIQLGVALNDPIAGIGRLRKAGVQLTEQQQKSIKTFMEQGDIMSAQKIILEELNNQFGGAASAFGDTAQGRLQIMQHAWGALQEQLAMGVLPVLERVGAKLTELFQSEGAAEMAQDVGKAVGEGLEAAIDIATKLPWEAIGSTFSLMGQGAKAVLQAFTSLPPWIQTAVLTGWGFNALTGGAAGNIAGMLAKIGLQKVGLLKVTAGVVHVNGGVGPAGPVKGGGGGLGLLGTVTIAGAALTALTLIATEIHKSANPTGHAFNELAGGRGASRVRVEGDLLALSRSMGVDVETLQSRAIPLLESGDRTWNEVVNQLRSGFSTSTAATDRAAAAARDAVPWLERNRAAIHDLNASEGTRAAAQFGMLNSINNKNWSPRVNVNATFNQSLSITASAVARSLVRHTQTTANISTNTGGI